MIQKIIYAVNSSDDNLLSQFIDRLSRAGIQTKQLESAAGKYSYFESVWNNAAEILPLPKRNHHTAGAKPKKLQYNGKSVTCGFIYLLRTQHHLSDAEIGALLDVSESTIARRRKKHSSDGNFYADSDTIF